MNILHLALNNIRRSTMRAFLTALSVMVAAATLVVVLSVDRGYQESVQRDLVENTGVHLYLTKEGCPIEASSVIAQGGLSPLYVEEEIIPMVEETEGVSAILPFKLFAETLPDGSRTDIFMGITDAIHGLRPDWTLEEGGWFEDEKSVILGADMAQIENVSVGDQIYSEPFDMVFTVTGILERSYSQDDGIFFLPLETAQKMINREGRLSAIALKLHDIDRLQEISLELRGQLPEGYYVLGAKELSDGILGFFAATRTIMFVMVGVAFGVSVFGIINTMLMAVMERKREIAYLKCVGARRSDILKLITAETLLICLAGALAGIILGLVITPIAGSFLRTLLVAYVPAGSIVSPGLDIVLLSLVLSVSTGLLCALYPALKASSIVPMEVLRNE
ncbi:ABC transporter permease [Chitinivibrio alkaliphilus]|uniref:ABC-type transport system, involved in lipoprotein release, permease component n=1 Tax=Chitinivibrio alkaliphilus ACht1 TaxID=1313304 RepID=U7D617_9BACT|nr:FtsX-like permease family protein [Chitinivibrio alkaliphilus]ERP31378.1 ABC-type transport system, involved in lipoprotein release, permease component [Chitinivibrio alkaliphilus ACht1]